MERGAYFLHEHPALATSWREPCVQEVLSQPGVRRIRADQCQLGQQNEVGDPVKKPTGFMSNSDELLKELERKCFGRNGLCSRPRGGRHAQCIGRVARRSAIFQEELCLGILRGIRKQMETDHRMHPGLVGVHAAMLTADDEIKAFRLHHATLGSEESICEDAPALAAWTGKQTFVDDLTGLPLPPDLCRAARQKELEYFRAKGV